MSNETLLFILVAGVILVLMLFRSNRGSGTFKVGGNELRIDFENSRGFQHPIRRPRQHADAPSARCYLHVKGTQWRFPLGKQHVYIGRGADCHIRLRDSHIDSRQAVIYLDDGRYRINNLSQTTPTLVNGQSISKQSLSNGSRIRMGQTEFIFRDKRQ